jgi:hypothetical protein
LPILFHCVDDQGRPMLLTSANLPTPPAFGCLLSPIADIAPAWREQLSSPPRPPIALRHRALQRFAALFLLALPALPVPLLVAGLDL